MLKQIGSSLKSVRSRYLLVAFYLIAGLNHFLNPDFYLPLIPASLPYPSIINYASGIVEIVLALMLLPRQSRKIASWGIVLMLIAFIPSHVYFIEIGSCVPNGLCVPPWIAILRLVLIHPFLIIWAYLAAK